MTSSARRYRVLLVVSSMDAGGLETYIVNVLSTLDLARFDVTIACTRSMSDWYSGELTSLGVTTLHCPNPYTQLSYVRRVAALMRRRRIEAVCDFRSGFAGPTMFAAWLVGVRSRIAAVRSTGVGYERTFLRNAYVGALNALTRRFATRILGNAEPVLDSFHASWRDEPKIYGVVPNGVDTATYRRKDGRDLRHALGLPEDAIVVGHVGRIHGSKDHRTIISAFAKLRESVRNARLLLVGDGVSKGEVERHVAELGLAKAVLFTGARKDVPALLSGMDIFFFPSRYEGLPNALLEAMSCELPIVASNIPEIAHVVPQELSSWLHDPGDTEAFANSLAALSAAPSTRKRLGRLGRDRVLDRFSIGTSAKRLSEEWTAPLGDASGATLP